MQQPLLDLSFLHEISGNDPSYIKDVLEIFLSSVPEGIKTLEGLVNDTEDWDAIHKQAHFLKSSAGIVRIDNIFEELNIIETLAKEKKDKDKIIELVGRISNSFNRALPLLIAEQEKHL